MSSSAPGAAVSRLEVPRTYNFRAVAPRALTPGRLYRSDALHRLSRAGRRRLADLGIRVVIDLRSDFDRRIGGRDRLRGTGAERVAIPISGASPGTDPGSLDLRGVYRSILTHHRDDLATAIRTIAAADGPVLVHCTAGKDRTGLVVALVLTAVGVDEETVVADYAATQANLAGEWTETMLRKVRRFRVPVTDNLFEVMAHSPASVLRDTLAWLEDEHGGVRSYLDTAGVDDAVVDRLRRALLPAAEMGG
ncbi:tyrosine-protein phosphatase [Ornithinimicrobium sp. F0845]|uniref:tyrosine-protein phosphatase n=1 Tax=Ornithinimicrobium sp. F0845 TaxID=2926412 RepID=UPI001FF25091|nr:tyrosine-protein phosphatase [Ornithinimicrobium sp. F0845]MCK0114096.1 tyrosine-protein phosphatase [Ornithinimicrobium sp. F0845]